MHQKDHSRANRGQAFEDLLALAHERYQRTGMACIHKVPTEFIPLRNSSGAVVSCKVEKKSCVDYLGRFRAVPVAVEAKHTDGDRIAFSRVEPHQAAYLNDFLRYPGAVALVVVSFRLHRFYAVPWEFWRAGMELWAGKQAGHTKAKQAPVEARGFRWFTNGMASLSENDMLPEWEIKNGGVLVLPYLHIIDRMNGGETK